MGGRARKLCKNDPWRGVYGLVTNPTQLFSRPSRGLPRLIPNTGIDGGKLTPFARRERLWAAARQSVLAALWMVLLVWPLQGADWPAFKHDNARSGVTAEKLAFPLAQRWCFVPRLAPEPAWETPRQEPVEGILELGRVQFDDAYHVVASGGAVYFGTGIEETLYCLDLETGRIRWADQAGGAIRLAPALAKGNVYYGADDGWVRCLDAGTGTLVWSCRVGPGRERMLGHGRMISRWPVRTGVLVEGNRAYFGAGIWPAEGVYMQAVRATDGELIWRNDTCGEVPESIMSPQGYLLASKTFLFAPHGRATPGAFDLTTGKYRGPAGFGKTVGGTNATICEDLLVTGTEEMLSYRPATKARFAWLPGRQAVLTPEVTYLATDAEWLALREKEYAQPSVEQFGLRLPEIEAVREVRSLERKEADLAKAARKDPAKEGALEELRQELQEARGLLASIQAEKESATLRAEQGVQWRIKVSACECLILAGDALVGGGEGCVSAVEAATGKPLWTARVEGRVRGLAVADGRLLVSSSTGKIYCFGPGAAGPVAQTAAPREEAFPEDALTALARRAAETMLRESGVSRGYALVLGCETGRLALELARRSALTIYVVEPDEKKAGRARRAWEGAGMSGRISVEVGPLDRLSFSDWFANLIVSERALHGQLEGLSPGEAARTLKPHGGVLLLGQPEGPESAQQPALREEDLMAWKEKAPELASASLAGSGGRWLVLRRGGVPGAGNWTHLYGNPGNTACGDDEVVGTPLSLLWYGKPGPLHMVSRHRRAASPLTAAGVLFFQGEHLVRGYDAYNGVQLWERDYPNVVRDTVSHDCSNMACDGASLYVASGTRCQRLESGTGRTLQDYGVPGAVAAGERWGYVATSEGRLFGSRAAGAKGRSLFAFNTETQKLLWEHGASEIPHPSISIADGRVYFVDDPAAGSVARQSLISRVERMQPAGAETLLQKSADRRVVCLDAASGKVVWERTMDLTGGIGGQYWSSLGSMVSGGVVVLFGVYTDGHFWKEFFAGQFESRRMLALDAADGRTLWDRKIAYRVRPLIIGDTLHAEPQAFDLRTGEPRLRENPVTGKKEAWQFARPGHHCGLPVAAPNLMLFRSGHMAYYDLKRDSGTMHFGGQRTGCWINFIPGNGLVMVPEASSGCMCAFPNQSTVVFKQGRQERAWSKFSYAGELTPVRNLALNLGAPGDRKDSQGRSWLGFPRPGGSLVAALEVDVKGVSGGEYFQLGMDFARVEGTDSSWLYSTGYRGCLQCSVPLLEPGDGVADYRVRLHFAGLPGEQAGQRVFDIKLQGEVREAGFDPVVAAGGASRAVVREFGGVRVDGRLEIALDPKAAKPGAANGPLLCGVEVERERVISVGVGIPEITLNRVEPSARVDVRVGNLRDNRLLGALEFSLAGGFAVEPGRLDLDLDAGGRHSFPVTLRVTNPDLPRGTYPLRARLVRKEGGVECELERAVHYLGNTGRIRIGAAEDAGVASSSRLVNRGTENSLMIDGGTAEMGDSGHAVCYLRFPLQEVRARGRLLSAVLRITNAGNPSSNGGDVRLVEGRWTETAISYDARPEPGMVLANLGGIASRQSVTVPLKLDLANREELGLAIVPVNTDGVDYLSRESGHGPELVVDYEPASK